MHLNTTISGFFRRKIATTFFISGSLATFATLGDDNGKKIKKEASASPFSAKNFSLRSNYNYRSNNFLSVPEKKEFIMLNPTVTFQKGNTAYVLPLKKAPLLGKINFTCAPKQF